MPDEGALCGTLCAWAGYALAGIDLLCEPYDAEADWRTAYRVARVAIEEGLGVTAHAGEFSIANLAAALAVPGLTRIGHATQAVRDDRLLERLAARGVTVECCLTSNVVLGAVAHLEEHPLPRLIADGIPVALGTDDPVELDTTIDREYVLAARLGLSVAQLTDLTRTAICASFTSPERKSELLVQLYASPGAEAARGSEETT